MFRKRKRERAETKKLVQERKLEKREREKGKKLIFRQVITQRH